MDKRIIENAVVQVNDRGQQDWIGCLVQVSEVKGWGIQGFVHIPKRGRAYIRLKWVEINYIGQAVMAVAEDVS